MQPDHGELSVTPTAEESTYAVQANWRVSIQEPPIEEKTTFEEGEAVLRLPARLGKDSLADFDYWIKGVLRKYRRIAGLAGEAAKSETEE